MARPLGSVNLNVNIRKNLEFQKFIDDVALEKVFKPLKIFVYFVAKLCESNPLE